MTAISTRGLTRHFNDLVAVKDISLDVRQGEIFGLVGPDGAGKTTTMRMLTGILEPTSGTASVAGYDIVQASEQLKEHIGYMSQRFGLYMDLTVMENIRFYADVYMVPKKKRAAQYEKLLSFSNLTPFKDRLAGQLSGGMKQKLGLACALIHTPTVLFLDEPTNGVDPVSRRDFWRILYQLLKDGVTIFFSTAYLDEAERCSRLALMHRGELLQVGSPDEIKKSIQSDVVQLTLADSRTARNVLREAYPDLKLSLYGEKIHVLSRDTKSTIPDVTTALKSAGISILNTRVVDPMLEDVFIELTADGKRSEVHHA
jgi:ABC-2 type transport system ATP-binding protein